MPIRSRGCRAAAATATVVASLLLAGLAMEGVLRLTSRPAQEPAVPATAAHEPAAPTAAHDPAAPATAAHEPAAPATAEGRPEKITVPDPELAWAFRPSAEGRFTEGALPTDVTTNSLGLRSPELEDEGGGTRVLVLGDSYGFGWGVAEGDAFPRILESRLRQRHPEADVAVINACLPGYGLYQQRAMLERVLNGTVVDVVVTTYSLANDPVDDLRIARFAPDRLLEYTPELGERNRFVQWLVGHSKLAGLVDVRLSPLRFKAANASARAVEISERCMRELLETCSNHGLRVLQVEVPQRWQTKGQAGSWLLAASSGRARAMRRRVASDFGVISIDCAPCLKRVESETGGAYIPNDAHWTRLGHEAVADTILAALPEEWFAPE